MTGDIWIRRARAEDMDAVVALNDAAFGTTDEGRITRQLQAEGDSVLSLVAVEGDDIVGHIEFFRVLIDGAPVGAGLGPMSVRPGLQKQGTGGALIRLGLAALEGAGEGIVFVLGHATYYPKFGFTAAAAQPFKVAWSGPHFMALKLSDRAPKSGVLTYPTAFSG
ncbi:MAG: GNAT family N-acetyltransferase [Hyphomonas sp.]